MDSWQFTFPIRSDKLSLNVKVSGTLFDQTSEYQRIQILETEVFGKMLLLDGHIQLTELDERAYHESLVHIPALSIKNLRRALVIGGGDGGVVRELTRHPALQQIDMIEIDQMVIDATLAHMPSVNASTFADPRVTVHVRDAFPFVKDANEAYDLIVMDSTDTYEDEEGALSEQLFTESFYQDCYRLLNPDGILVTQADNLVFCPYSLEEIKETYAKVFPVVEGYQGIVPSFGGFSGFCYASKGAIVEPSLPICANQIDLRYLNSVTYALAFRPFQFK